MRRIGVVGVLAWASVAGGLDKPAFTATPQELLDAAGAADAKDSAAIVLRDEQSNSYDEQGRTTVTYRMVIAIKKPAAIDDWGALSYGWSPFYQDKPVIRARVITTDGKVTELDPSLITDAPAVSTSPSVFSDRRVLEAPLPRLAIGAVIEETITVKDREVLLAAGTTDIMGIGRGVPTERTITTISAPASRKPKVVLRGLPKVTPKVTTANGRTTWVFDLARIEARTHYEESVPGDVVTRPYIGVATGASWGAVAVGYRKILDDRMKDGVALPADLKAATQRETVDRIVAWLHKHVRYTGIEFSDAAIVPWTPNDTVKRGFGDCKDKATLLVSLLRAAGLRADLALLETGPGIDSDPDLPGMGVFDHAIVRAKVDGRDFWIDATEDTLPAGQLPARDQNRRALIVADDTKAPVLTPLGASTENVIHETRAFQVAEAAHSNVVETSTESGVFADSQRVWLRDTRPDDIKKNLTQYADDVYLGKLDKFSSTDPNDIGKPFVLTVEITKSTRAYSERGGIEIYVFPHHVLGRLPAIFTNKDQEYERDVKERQFDYAFFKPHVYEIEHRYVIPTGFVMPKLDAKTERTLGTMKLVTTREIRGDTLVVTIRLDTGKPRITPAELAATRTAILELKQREGEHIVVPLASEQLIAQGKYVEAIAEINRLIALHPKEAVHYTQLAEAYRRTGMGAAARRAAQKAVDLEPANGDAYAMLAWILRHDLFGRSEGPDIDRKGALAAYRKAIALSPEHIGAHTDLASLLISGANGKGVTDDKAAFVEAAALLRKAKEIGKTTEYDEQIVRDLILGGRFDEAETAARALGDSNTRGDLLVTIVALSRGAQAAIDTARSIAKSNAFTRMIGTAVSEAMRSRRYDLVRELLDASAILPPAQTKIFAKLAPVDLAKLDPADPKTPALLAALSMMSAQIPKPAPWDTEVGLDLADETSKVANLPQLKTARAFAGNALADVVGSFGTYTSDGNAKDGWRVEADFSGNKAAMYVIAERGKARLIGLEDAAAGVGKHVLSLLAKNDIDGAKRWLDRVAQDAVKHNNVAARLYRATANPSKELLEVFAAAIAASRYPKLALPIVKACKGATDDELKKLCAFDAMFLSRDVDDFASLEVTARKYAELDPALTPAYALRAMALAHLGRAKEGLAVLDDALAKTPKDDALLSNRAMVAIAAGWDVAEPWFAKREPNAGLEELNNIAWSRLYFDKTPDKARELADRLRAMKTPLPTHMANTVAAIEAESDHPYEGWKLVLQAIEAHDDQQPDNADWYVIGRIAEGYGLRDDAIAAYRKVAKPKRASVVQSAYDYARRNLARLGVK